MDGTAIRPSRPVKGKPGWSVERVLPGDSKSYLTYGGYPSMAPPFMAALNLVGPSSTRKPRKILGKQIGPTPKEVYGSITVQPGRMGKKTSVGEMYVADSARKQMGGDMLTPALALADSAFAAGGRRSFHTNFANKRLAVMAKAMRRRGRKYFDGAGDNDFEDMGLPREPGANDMLYDPYRGELVPRHAARPSLDELAARGIDIDDWLDPESGDFHPHIDRAEVPTELWDFLMDDAESVARYPDAQKYTGPGRKKHDFGGKRGAGHDYEPDTTFDLPWDDPADRIKVLAKRLRQEQAGGPRPWRRR
jgi:hypothetical protein